MKFSSQTSSGVEKLKSTGLIRRIDELGRIVIPKEIRRSLGIRDGEYLEIFLENEKIILQKQMLINNVGDLCNNLVVIIKEFFNIKTLITDRNLVIASNINLKDERLLSKKYLNFIDNREIYIGTEKENLDFLDDSYYVISIPIIVDADSIGLLIMLFEEKLTASDINIAKFISKIIVDKLTIS